MSGARHPRPMVVLDDHDEVERDLSRMSDEKHAEADALEARAEAHVRPFREAYEQAKRAVQEYHARAAELRRDGNRLAGEATAHYLQRLRVANGDPPR